MKPTGNGISTKLDISARCCPSGIWMTCGTTHLMKTFLSVGSGVVLPWPGLQAIRIINQTLSLSVDSWSIKFIEHTNPNNKNSIRFYTHHGWNAPHLASDWTLFAFPLSNKRCHLDKVFGNQLITTANNELMIKSHYYIVL